MKKGQSAERASKSVARKLTRAERQKIRASFSRICDHVEAISALTLAIASAVDGVLDPEVLAKVTVPKGGRILSVVSSLAVYERTAATLKDFLTREAKSMGVRR